MKRTRMRRQHVPYFCERCGKEEFEGRVFGQDRVRYLQAQSGDRTMLCNDCNPKAIKLPAFEINSWFLPAAETEG